MSRIWQHQRTVGLVSTHVPACIRYHAAHGETYCVTSVGHAFHTYSTSHLGLVTVSDLVSDEDGEIEALACDHRYVYVSCRRQVLCFTQGRYLRHRLPPHSKPIHLLLPLPPCHLVTVDDEGTLRVWTLEPALELYLELDISNPNFHPTSLLHPATYMNKLLVGSSQGRLQLWNVRRGKLVHEFRSLREREDSVDGGGQQRVTALEQSPACHVVAVGDSSGLIYLLNLRYDEVLFSFHLSDEWGSVTSITFRLDGPPHILVGSQAGHIAVWHLERRQPLTHIRNAHAGGVAGLTSLHSQPLIYTNGPDNSLKLWIFDSGDDGVGRVLRSREGHAAPPTRVRFYGDQGKLLLTTGLDSCIRQWSSVHDKYSKNLGRAWRRAGDKKKKSKINKKIREGEDEERSITLPPITELAVEVGKERDWSNIVALHRGLPTATTWSQYRSTMGDVRLKHKRFTEGGELMKKGSESDKNEVKVSGAAALCCTVTSCGNYALVGYTSGHVDCFNLQSGGYRGSYHPQGTDISPHQPQTPVRGVVVDALNRQVVTVCQDGCMRWYRFRGSGMVGVEAVWKEMELDGRVGGCVYLHRATNLLCVCLDSVTIIMVDITTQQIVRRFSGHTAPITDLLLSDDGRWLISSSMDSTVRTWDVAGGWMLDASRPVQGPVTSLSLTSSGHLLATTHLDELGVVLWVNRTLYTPTTLTPLPDGYDITLMDEVVDEMVDEMVDEYLSPAQIDERLVTLSTLPYSRWKSLAHLDVVKARNKPKEAPSLPARAPFFLPTTSTLEGFTLQPPPDAASMSNVASSSRVSTVAPISEHLLPALCKLLLEGDNEKVVDMLKGMSPSQIDVEVRFMSARLTPGTPPHLLPLFVSFLSWGVATGREWQLYQALISLTLTLHSRELVERVEIGRDLEGLLSSMTLGWEEVEDEVRNSQAITNYVRSVII